MDILNVGTGLLIGGFVGVAVGYMRGMEAGERNLARRLARQREQQRMKRTPHPFVEVVTADYGPLSICAQCGQQRRAPFHPPHEGLPLRQDSI